MYLDQLVDQASKRIFAYKEPIAYLRGRGFNDEDIKKYKIGYLKVAKLRKEESKDYEEFHKDTYCFKLLENRIIIPLRNVLGKVNGVIVRAIEEKRYKIILLGEAKKIGGVFGLHEALPHIIRTRKVFVHEGAFNSMAWSKVFPNSVASLTSMINDAQYDLLTMIADKIILVYDDDKQGKESVQKLLERYGPKIIHFISLGYKDSNNCLQVLGFEKFRAYIKNRTPLLLQQ